MYNKKNAKILTLNPINKGSNFGSNIYIYIYISPNSNFGPSFQHETQFEPA